jgi:hypothetical protein
MTQDPYGQPPGSGYVVRGEVVPDDEADPTPPEGPLTRFQKVASALRGDRTDPAIPVQQPVEPAGEPPTDPIRPAGEPPTDPIRPAGESATDPNGTWPRANQAADPQAEAAQEAGQDTDAAHPEDVGAVRSPDDGRDYWDEADEETSPGEATATAPPPDSAAAEAATMATRPDGQDPTMTQPALYGSAARADAGTGADAGPAAGADEAGAAEADAGGAAEADAGGEHAGAPVQGGLRPGESDHGLGDFSDLTFGSLLPDASEFKARWQQVQFRFVDDPQGSVTEAADVISQVTAKLEAAIQERQRAIAERQRTLRDRWSQGKSTDTEWLRETLLMYRTFLDQLTGPKTG